MPKKPSPIIANIVNRTVENVPLNKKKLVFLNFAVPDEFRERFRRRAFDNKLKYVQLLDRAFEAWEREQDKKRK